MTSDILQSALPLPNFSPRPACCSLLPLILTCSSQPLVAFPSGRNAQRSCDGTCSLHSPLAVQRLAVLKAELLRVLGKSVPRLLPPPKCKPAWPRQLPRVQQTTSHHCCRRYSAHSANITSQRHASARHVQAAEVDGGQRPSYSLPCSDADDW